jgi:ketosteroid isomerase-like protein
MPKFIKSSMAILFLFLLFAGSGIAQQWSAEQLDVWKSVQTYNDLARKGDVNGFLSYFDDSFVGWPYGSDASHTKAIRAEWIKYYLPNSTNLMTTLTPEAIWVKGDFAFVHYYYSSIDKDKEGKVSTTSGRWTDILMKKGDRWVMIGDHGGQTSK